MRTRRRYGKGEEGGRGVLARARMGGRQSEVSGRVDDHGDGIEPYDHGPVLGRFRDHAGGVCGDPDRRAARAVRCGGGDWIRRAVRVLRRIEPVVAQGCLSDAFRREVPGCRPFGARASWVPGRAVGGADQDGAARRRRAPRTVLGPQHPRSVYVPCGARRGVRLPVLDERAARARDACPVCRRRGAHRDMLQGDGGSCPVPPRRFRI